MEHSNTAVRKDLKFEEALYTCLRRPPAALHGVQRYSAIAFERRFPDAARLAFGHARSLVQSFFNPYCLLIVSIRCGTESICARVALE